MMVFTGESFTLGIDYIVDDEFIIPSAATISVRDRDGSLLVSADVLDVSQTSTTYEIAAIHNTLAGNNTIEHRFVSVTMIYEGQQFTKTYTYRVVEFLPIATTPEDVRAELGLDVSELPDRDIDIFWAYHQLAEEYGDTFTDALESGTVISLQANQAIAVKAAVNLCGSLPFRAGTKFSSEENRFERQGDFDVDAIAARLGAKLANLMDSITSEETGTFDRFLLATPTDVITGV